MSIKPRRSVLYMPGSNQRAIDKARSLPADAVVLDLEDSVGPAMKVEARDQVVAAVKAGGFGEREVVVRANAVDSEWGEADIRAIAGSSADGLCLPKIESAAEIRAAAALLQQGAADMPIWAMIETPKGVANAADIAAAGVAVLVMGTTDLAKELRVPHTPDRLGLQYSLSQCVLAARLQGIDVLDGVYLDLNNPAGFEQVCQQGRVLGFDGKTLIHPRQIEAANQAFGPDPQQAERAEKIIAAWQQVEAEGKGVAVVDGKLVEAMHVDEARRTLALLAAIETMAE